MKRLYRSTRDRMLAGICGGLGEHFDVDPNLVRLIWVAGTIVSFGTGIIVYLVAWLLLPEEPGGAGEPLSSPPQET